MRKLSLGNPLGRNDFDWVRRGLKTIEQASYEDMENVFDEYTVTGVVTEQRTFDAGAATATDLRNVLATLITDIQKRGSRRNEG